MKTINLKTKSAFAVGACALGVWAVAGVTVRADEIETSAKFAAPKRIKVGDKFLGEGRYYPSPVWHDVDGDGTPEVVVADLMGRVTVATGKPSLALATETPMLMKDGKPLKFHNW
jgi:hypothetical protein